MHTFKMPIVFVKKILQLFKTLNIHAQYPSLLFEKIKNIGHRPNFLDRGTSNENGTKTAFFYKKSMIFRGTQILKKILKSFFVSK